MYTYIMVSFIAGIIGIIIRLMIMSIAKYPRTSKTSLGTDVACTMIALGFALWAGILLFM